MGSFESRDFRHESIFCGLAALVYGLFGYFSPGYDDEFHNISLYVGAYGGGLSEYLGAAASDAVHPPGSYLLNFLLRAVLGDWSLVRAVSGSAVALAVAFFVDRFFRFRGWALVAAFAVIILSPTLLLWGTSLRWIGPFTACLSVLLVFTCNEETARAAYWIRFGMGVLFLCSLNYLGLLFAPVLLLYALYVRRKTVSREIRPAMVTVVLVLVGYAPELIRLRGNLEGAMAAQTGSLLRSAVGVLHGSLVNSGIFPLSVPGAVALLGTAGGIVMILISHLRTIAADSRVWLLSALVGVLTVSGLGGKFRNVTPLIPLLLGVVVAYALMVSRQQRLTLTGLALVGATNFLGCFNLLQHEGTAKGSWNTPVRKVVRALAELTSDCTSTFVLTRDPLLAYHTDLAGYPVLMPITRERALDSPSPAGTTIPAEACVAGLITFRGSLDAATFASLMSDLDFESARHAFIGKDPHAAVKRLLDRDIPDYYVELRISDRMERPMILRRWENVSLARPRLRRAAGLARGRVKGRLPRRGVRERGFAPCSIRNWHSCQ